MPKIGEDVIEHRSNVDPKAQPIKQKKRNFNTEKYKVIAEEVDRCLVAGFIKKLSIKSGCQMWCW